MNNSPSLAFFVPAYNEADNLPGVVNRIHEFCEVSKITERSIIIVDDGSSDHTNDVIDELRQSHEFVVVSHIVNKGYGAALRSGLDAAVETGHKWIAFCDGDGQFDPMDTMRLMAAVNSQHADVAIGYREERADNWRRRLIGRAWHWLSSFILGYKAKDVDCGFKLFSRRSILAIQAQLCGEHATISPEILMRLQRCGFKIVEESMPHYPRVHGEQTGTNFHVMWSSFTGLMKVRQITRKDSNVYDVRPEHIAA
ncbi:glycosyltransferase family 2 protein [Candidatus Saccharibacteria bacterium]|nr:glycosyltransferase family 2 protein [Candidatus Saccharibacteria bacterium]MBH2007038.1 glycosyltransferase family 2 protein [Candidatus Saccharibacteria bacterium]